MKKLYAKVFGTAPSEPDLQGLFDKYEIKRNEIVDIKVVARGQSYVGFLVYEKDEPNESTNKKNNYLPMYNARDLRRA